MPIEIRELHIKAVVGESGEENTAPQNRQVESASAPATGKDTIVAECVEKVLEILQMKMER